MKQTDSYAEQSQVGDLVWNKLTLLQNKDTPLDPVNLQKIVQGKYTLDTTKSI